MSALTAVARNQSHHRHIPPGTGFLTLALGSIVFVFADIGASLLYALKESLTAAANGIAVTGDAMGQDVMGAGMRGIRDDLRFI